VYASAVHAKWIWNDGKSLISAMAVASEPEIFWDGNTVEAQNIISGIKLPENTGSLILPNGNLNGPSGKVLDEMYLKPLGFTRNDVWLCDLVPYSCMNGRQEKALKTKYDPKVKSHGLPEYNWTEVPKELTNETRRKEIVAEIELATPDVIITLGDQPLKWFTRYFGSFARLRTYCKTDEQYGQKHTIQVSGKKIELLPLVHPRQAGGLGLHSPKWKKIHEDWVQKL
ncbi:hypothetical protein K8I28_11110, partial [bacterium]|nr:hypothetical protein [bacterium]